MNELFSSLFVKTITTISIVMLLYGCCSNYQSYKHTINGRTSYLNVDMSKFYILKTPHTITLPKKNPYFNIPTHIIMGSVGKNLDIRPPVVPLVFKGRYAKYWHNTCTLTLNNIDVSWSKIINSIKFQNIPIIQRNDKFKKVITDWVQWHRYDEKHQYQGRYVISLTSFHDHQVFSIKLCTLKQSNRIVNSSLEINRYTIMMFNRIINHLLKTEKTL